MVPSYIQLEGSTNGFFTNLLDYDCYKTSGPSDPEKATTDQNCCKKKLQLCEANQGHWFPDALST
jgi:hypothetical protein